MAFLGALSGIGSIIGAIGANNRAKQASSAAGDAFRAENKVLGSESDTIDKMAAEFGVSKDQLLKLYPQLAQTVGKDYKSAQGTAAENYAAGTGQDANALRNNPYINQISQAAQGLQSYDGLRKPEIQELQNTMGRNNASAMETLGNRMGGTANGNALIEQINAENQQRNLGLTSQLGDQAARQELQARESGMQGLATAGSSYDQAHSAAGNLGLGAAGVEQGLNSQNLSYRGMNLDAYLNAIKMGQSAGGDSLNGAQGLAAAYGGQGASYSGAAGQAAGQASKGFGAGISGLIGGIGGLSSNGGSIFSRPMGG